MRTSRLGADLSRRVSGALIRFVVLTITLLVAAFSALDLHRAAGQDTPAPPGEIDGVDHAVELAPYMGELQRLTHKLSLSIANENYPLASFYLYESLESLEDMKQDVPEYRGLPVALLIDQLSTPAFKALKDAIERDTKDSASSLSPVALTAVITACNQCHIATRHEFIKITNRGDFNPFNQDFRP